MSGPAFPDSRPREASCFASPRRSVAELGWNDVVALAEKVVACATDGGVTLGCAESCTGGMVAAALTSVAGSSAAFLGGVVSYAPSVKHAVLGVPASVIDAPGVGVVSSECARAMAAGAARVTGASIVVATTGIAGPTGAEPGKPVGTVYVATCVGVTTHARRLCFSGDRERVRLCATHAALEALYEEIVRIRCAK